MCSDNGCSTMSWKYHINVFFVLCRTVIHVIKILILIVISSNVNIVTSADDEAYPTQFLATQVKVPASSGKTSLMTRVALLSS